MLTSQAAYFSSRRSRPRAATDVSAQLDLLLDLLARLPEEEVGRDRRAQDGDQRRDEIRVQAGASG